MVYPVWINGTWMPADSASVSIKDIGFLRGYGIFDFFRIMDGNPVFMSDHLDRFLRSAHWMGISSAYSKEELGKVILEIAAQSIDTCLGVKLILTGGDSLNGFEPAESNLYILPAVFSFADPAKGMRLISKEYVREMAEIKSLNYAFSIRHWPEVKAAGADDLLYFTEADGVSESSRSNLFYVKNGVIYTPREHILEGITRKHVIELARKDYVVNIQSCSLADFLTADEVFTTGSTKRVLPIYAIDGHVIKDGKIGPITQDLYTKLVLSESTGSQV